mgnify:CR=1 FL=1
MATITPKILKKNEYKNGTWRVLYRLSHDRKSRYISTRHFVPKEFVVGSDDISTDFIIDYLAADIKKYRNKINSIENIEVMSIDDVLSMITSDRSDVDLISFFRSHIGKLRSEGREKTAKPFVTVLNSIIDFNGEMLYASKLTSKFLEKYELFLRRPKLIKRKQGQNTVVRETSVNDKGLHNHMAALRTLFNAAKSHFNDEDTGNIIIKNAPFSKYNIVAKKQKKHKNLSLDMIRIIRDYEPKTKREQTAKQMFMLSFYMCGMNAVDIFNNWDRLKKLPKRIGYNRSKTEGKREDGAYISVSIPECAKQIISSLEITYSKIDTLNNSLSIGLRSIATNIALHELTMLFARHSFATIARNDLNISKEDVAVALNHVSDDTRITDTYIAPDWSKIDRVQQAVISKINEDL